MQGTASERTLFVNGRQMRLVGLLDEIDEVCRCLGGVCNIVPVSLQGSYTVLFVLHLQLLAHLGLLQLHTLGSTSSAFKVFETTPEFLAYTTTTRYVNT